MRNRQIDLLEEMLIVSNVTMQFQGISQEFIYIRKKNFKLLISIYLFTNFQFIYKRFDFFFIQVQIYSYNDFSYFH